MIFSGLKKKTDFYCFTPEVMIGTFIFEIAAAIFVLLRYKISRFSLIAVALLVSLAAFQIVEYQICADSSHPLIWAKIGFVAITLLPVLGLYLISLVTKKKHFLNAGYLVAGFFLLYFAFSQQGITEVVCGGNYVIFNGSGTLYWLYGLYYFSFLVLAIWEAVEKMLEIKRDPAAEKILFWIIVGYLSFLIPAGLVYFFFDVSTSALPSIMCGFAILFALILILKILPAYNARFGEKRVGKDKK